MKKIVKELKILAFAIMLCVCFIICASCSEEVVLDSVDFIIDANTPTEYVVGEFDYSGYKLIRNYSDGTVEELPFSEEYISEVEQVKLWQPGEQTISFEYEGEQFSFTCNFTRNNFDEIKLLPLNIIYDGQPHEVQFKGAIPSGTTVKINNGNSLFYTDAGSYTASVTLMKEGYITKDLTAEVNIAKATYDTSTFSFEDEYFEYDSNLHALEIKGTLPQGVSVRYFMNNSVGNTAKNIGDYKVTAEFTYTNLKNYEPLESITRTLHITKRSVDLEKFEKDFKDKLDKNLLYYDGESKLETIKSGIEFPKEIDTDTIKYSFNKLGEDQEINDIKYAGNYQVKIGFDLRLEYKNECVLNRDYIAVDFSVQKAFFSTSQFADMTTVYTGEPQSLKLQDAKIPTYYNHDPIYYIKPFGASDSEYKKGNSATYAGKYTVKIEFPDDENFANIPSRTATLTIEKCYYDLSMPDNINQQYDGTVYTLQEIVDKINLNVKQSEGLNFTVRGLGVNGDILPQAEISEETPTTEATVTVSVVLKMYKINYIKDENEYNQLIETIKGAFRANGDKAVFEQLEKQKVEKTDGIGLYLIVGSCESAQYESNEKVVIYSITPRITDFSRPKNETRINYDGQDHIAFFDLEIPSYIVNEGKNFYTKRIFETEQDGTKIREVSEVRTAGYYCCEYQLVDDPNFVYTCGSQFTVKEFEIRKIVISSESLKGFVFTTLVIKTKQDILNEAKKSITERYPLMEYGRDYVLEVVDANSDSIVFPIDPSKQYYLQITLLDEINYVAYEGTNPITVLKQKFDIVDPKPIDDLQLIPVEDLKPDSEEAIYYLDNTADVRTHIRDSILTVVYDYKDLVLGKIEFFTIDGTKINDKEDLNQAGKYYVEVSFVDSFYYTIDGKNTDLKKTIYFEYKKKIIIDTKTDERLRGNCSDENFKYIFYTADNYKVGDIIAMTDHTLEYYMNAGLQLIENPIMVQIQSDGASVKRDNTYSLINGGEFKITYRFQDNYDFIIDGRSTSLTYNVMVKVIKVTELKASDLSFSLDSKGANEDMYQDVINKIHSVVSGYTNLNIRVEQGKEQLTIKKNNTTYTSITDVGTFNVTVKFESNGIYYRRIDANNYTLDDLTYNFTVEIKSKSPQLGTLYCKAENDHEGYGLVFASLIVEAATKAGLYDIIEYYHIYKNGREIDILHEGIYSKDFGYYTYRLTYTDKTYYADSTGTIVFAPHQKVYIDGNLHGNGAFYGEFILDGKATDDGFRDLHFKGAAVQLSDYFASEWKNAKHSEESAGWGIYGHNIGFKISSQRMNEYLNWKYGFFTFSDKIKNALTGENEYSIRVERKSDEWYSEGGHGGTVKFGDQDISL